MWGYLGQTREKGLEIRINRIITDLANVPAVDRNFTKVIDVKISAGYQEYIATIIFDN